jgi:hypothetical protein
MNMCSRYGRVFSLRSEYFDEEFARLISTASDDDSGASELDFLSDVVKALTLGKQWSAVATAIQQRS